MTRPPGLLLELDGIFHREKLAVARYSIRLSEWWWNMIKMAIRSYDYRAGGSPTFMTSQPPAFVAENLPQVLEGTRIQWEKEAGCLEGRVP